MTSKQPIRDVGVTGGATSAFHGHILRARRQIIGRPMASWQAHITDMFARVTVKPRLAGKKDLARARAILSSGTLPPPAGALYREATLEDVSGEWVIAAHAAVGGSVLL